ncbi:hypothetical protein Ancab_001964, partial [Ancistrocladus abbreviatus]
RNRRKLLTSNSPSSDITGVNFAAVCSAAELSTIEIICPQAPSKSKLAGSKALKRRPENSGISSARMRRQCALRNCDDGSTSDKITSAGYCCNPSCLPLPGSLSLLLPTLVARVRQLVMGL